MSSNEDKAEALKLEGNKLVGKKNWKGAAEKYNEAISLDPTKAAYFSNLALCHEMLDDLISFKEAATKCIEVDPSFIKGYYRLSKAHALLWEYDQQLDVLERGLAVEGTNLDLQKMHKVAKQCLDHINKFDEVVLDAPSGSEEESSSLAYFGGGAVNKLPPNTKYATLERLHIPPIYKKYECLRKYDDKVKPLMKSFYKGTLKIKWHCPTTDTIEVDGYLPNGGETVPVISFKGKRERQFFANGFQTAHNKLYHKELNSEEKQHLCIVMMLRFLAAKGSQLELDEQTTFDLIDALVKMCTQHSLYHDIVHAKMIAADIAFSKGCKVLFKVIRVAEALEAAKRYQEAGEIYCEVTDAGKYTQDPDAPAMVLHGYAGLAFKRAQDYEQAEREYVTSLRLAGPHWGRQIQMEESPFHFDMGGGNSADDNLQNMLIFYEIAHRAVVCGFRNDEAHKRMQLANHILVALLYTAGYRKTGNTMFRKKKLVKIWKDQLKPQYKNSGEALQAVVHATMASTIEEYHERLLNCFSGDAYEFVSDHSQAERERMLAEFLADQKERSRESSRDVIRDQGVTIDLI
ncbi:hypothetical protein ACHAWC_010331 [Mediolabrus comicus]